MLSENRIYHAIGMLNVSRSRALNNDLRPKDDKQNWLFLDVGHRRFSFVYKIDQPGLAKYNTPFKIILAFTIDYDVVTKFVYQNRAYDVLRGEEDIGSIEILEFLPAIGQGSVSK